MSSIDLGAEADLPVEQIDSDYNARATVTVEEFERTMGRYRDGSLAARSIATAVDVVYDEESGQTIDIFGGGDEPRPVFVYIHGGYWRALSKTESAFMAPMLAGRGIATVAVDYRLAPEVDLAEIVREVRAAIAFLHREGRRYGLDPSRIYVGGSSAGGHLTGAVISGGWHEAFGVPEDVVKGALPVSGLFHLGPIAKSFVSEWLTLTDSDVAALSPALNIPKAGCPIVAAYAAGEPAGFGRQSQGYHALWQSAGFDSTLMEIPDRHHFDVVLDLERADTQLAGALLQMIR
ncbi:alpha/beta hydrolase [Amorphus orientalis]|uniref:Arylformamidase n=1 Tax=Amorphus orientalis TaxID=649198 RepID=A0AAE3VT39_9HYPH|nr:alpha/beta hydrolase [Amorphus orientalis]MDQ0317626.1 arylformamidase [Amorphus orientalis]